MLQKSGKWSTKIVAKKDAKSSKSIITGRSHLKLSAVQLLQLPIASVLVQCVLNTIVVTLYGQVLTTHYFEKAAMGFKVSKTRYYG